MTISGAAIGTAQRPAQNVNVYRHTNIAAAQRLAEQALQRISVAQQVNAFDLNGHAQRAKDLLEQADKELKLAAERRRFARVSLQSPA